MSACSECGSTEWTCGGCGHLVGVVEVTSEVVEVFRGWRTHPDGSQSPRIDDELWQAATERAKARRESVVNVIRRALLAYVEEEPCSVFGSHPRGGHEAAVKREAEK